MAKMNTSLQHLTHVDVCHVISFGLGFDKHLNRQPICFIQMSTRAIDIVTCQDLGAEFYLNNLKIASIYCLILCVIHTASYGLLKHTLRHI